MEIYKEKSSEINYLIEKITNEEVLNTPEYNEFSKYVERIIELSSVENELKKNIDDLSILRLNLNELKKLEEKEYKYFNLLNNTGVGAVGLAAVLGALSTQLIPVLAASAVGATAALSGFIYKLIQDKKEINIAKSISSKIVEMSELGSKIKDS